MTGVNEPSLSRGVRVRRALAIVTLGLLLAVLLFWTYQLATVTRESAQWRRVGLDEWYDLVLAFIFLSGTGLAIWATDWTAMEIGGARRAGLAAALLAATAACREPAPPGPRRAPESGARSAPRAADATVDHRRPPDAGPPTLELKPYLRKGKCEIKLLLLVAKGTPRDAELMREFEQLVVTHALGPWAPGKKKQRADLKPFFQTKFTQDEMMGYAFGVGTGEQLRDYAESGPSLTRQLPPLAELPCPPGEHDSSVLWTDVKFAPAGGGLYAVRMVEYSRYNRVSAFMRTDCYLIDPAAGTIASTRAGLSARVIRQLSKLAERAVARAGFDQYTYNGAGAEIGKGTQLCVEGGALHVEYQAGEIGAYTPNEGPSVKLPTARVLQVLPEGSALRRALEAVKR
jgi:hypothetical protein